MRIIKMKMARVGVLLDQHAMERRHRFGLNVFEAYVGEVLSHAGIPFHWLHHVNEIGQSEWDVLIVACAEDDAETANAVWDYALRGGIVISYAGLNNLAGKLGCLEQPELAVGYADLASRGQPQPIRWMRAKPWETGSGSAFPVRKTGMLKKESPFGESAGSALLQFQVGQGGIDRWSVNIPYSIVVFQQGTGPVLSDGVPARDGSANVDEGILKADDRCAMDWEWDRLRTETGAPYFAYPYADWWREQLIGHLLQRVISLGKTLPMIGYWPEGVSCVTTISHDSDLNVDESAETTLQVLSECGIRSTWCMLEPGFSPHIYEKVKQAGHELAFHFNALEMQGGKWTEEEFDRQFQWLKNAAGLAAVRSNKNHYTRFEGWGELFEWCEKHGIQADQTRGPSKRGNIGFLFGTCHPYFPIAWFDRKNRLYDVLEISFLTQDLDHRSLADSSVIVPFLEQVRKAEGAAHFLFHQIHIHQQPKVNQAIRSVVAEARKKGFAFWTSAEINDWERRRRNIRITGISPDGQVEFQGEAGTGGVVVWVPEPFASGQEEVRCGVPCKKIVLDAQRIRETGERV